MVFHRVGVVRMEGASPQTRLAALARSATHQTGCSGATGGGPILADRGVAILARSEGYGLRYAPGARLKLCP